jgi:hypothetical protein
MATFYLDFENGNNANDGTTFANRWKTITSGATAARIAPGDVIRIMGSPAPTSLGQNGVWTGEALQAIKGISSSTNATPIAITCNNHGYSTGDTVVITGHVTNTNANGTWEITNTGTNTFTLDGSVGNGVGSSGTARLRNNTRVILASAVTQNIASTGAGRAAWVPSANVTATLSTTTKEHVNSDSIAIAVGFTTGLAAYWATPSTLDLSGYQQVSFWIQQTAGTIGAAGAVDLRLCSDAAGVTAVNTISIPNLAVTGRWMPVTVDLGTNLGNSIQSIALYVNTDNGAQTFLLSNIIACKASSAADSLTLTSLIGKNTTGETFWGVQSINGTRVMLDADTSTNPTTTTLRGYYGASETVTTWKRETIKQGPATATSSVVQSISDNGTDGSSITFSGGWNRTDMSTQTLETWLDGQNGNGVALDCSREFITVEKLAFSRFNLGFRVNTVDKNYGQNISLIASNNNTRGMEITAKSSFYSSEALVANISNSFLLGVQSGGYNTFLLPNASSNGGPADFQALYNGDKLTCTAKNNNGAGINFGAPANNAYSGLGLVDCVTEDNSSAGVGLSSRPALVHAKNILINEALEVGLSTFYASYLFSENHDQTAGNHKIFMDGALISAATDQRNTPSGVSWKIQPTNSTTRGSFRPVILSLAKVACAANSLVTIKAYMRRSNTDLTMRLMCKGGQIAGVTADQVSTMSAAADTWEELTITFTPTEVGVVEITAEAWGGTTFSGWVDDMTISQA